MDRWQRLRRRPDLLLAILLVALTWVVYAPVRHHDFVTYDDSAYVTENAQVQEGITLESVRWAFTATTTGNWIPVTWVSHMIDCGIWGVDPRAHHLVNVALHTANVLVLFLLLNAMTGAAARSAFVAAAFAIHPLHVESVAWVAERKDLLSTLFGLLAIAVWARWTRRGGTLVYGSVLGLYALSLASKPMLITLPFLLVLLDVWPLGRWKARDSGARRLIVEKLPMLVLAAASAIVAIVAQSRGGATASLEAVGIGSRLENALVSVAVYALDAVRPVDLGVLYPLREHTPAWMVGSAAFFVAAVTILVIAGGRRRPWLAVGWLWYLVSLLPVLGLVQVGVQSHADRYTYLPLEGLLLMAAWGVPDLLGRTRPRRSILVAVSVVVLAAWALLARQQLGHWRDSITLYRHALEVDHRNPVIHYNLADSLADAGSLDEALDHYRAALSYEPDFLGARNNLANTLRRMGRLDEAIATYRAALRYDPRYSLGHNNLGLALAEAGRLDEAAAEYDEALRLDPGYVGARRNLGRALFGLGRLEEAAARFREVLAADPDDAEARYRLGNVLWEQGRPMEAVDEYERSLAMRPNAAAVRVRLAAALAGLGRTAEAVPHYCQALQLDPQAEGLARVGALPRSRPMLDEALASLRERCPLGPESRRSVADGRATS